MLAVAFAVQPGGSGAPASPGLESPTIVAWTPTATPEPSPADPLPSPSATATPGIVDDVAGARATGTPAEDTAEPTPTPDFSAVSSCGPLDETTVALSVEQSLAGVSVRATGAAVYPIEYFQCILEATGGPEAEALARAVDQAWTRGATHAVVIDLWLANATRSFAQVDLNTTQAAAAGLTFAPLATLGSNAEVVLASGQGRAITLVVAPTNTLGPTPGPITLTIGAPLIGGDATAGRYQLFLPTP